MVNHHHGKTIWENIFGSLFQGKSWLVGVILPAKLLTYLVPKCQINDAKPGRTLAYREQRPSRAKHTEWTHVVSTAPPQRGGEEFSGFTSPGRTGAPTRSGRLTKRARLSASLVRGWIFGCLSASEKSRYRKHGPNMLLTGTGSIFATVRLDPAA